MASLRACHYFNIKANIVTMKKCLLFLATALLMCSTVLAQSSNESEKIKSEKPKTEKPKKFHLKVYGFVRNYFNYDSRNTYYVCGGEYNMIPKDEELDINGDDLNAVPSAHFLALSTRVGLNLYGPRVWGAETSGKIEGDFAGFGSNNSVFRIRQAYVKLTWNNDEDKTYGDLLLGQTWHPLSGDIMPEVLGMAAGAPFRAHSRTPQLRYQWYSGRFGFTASALYQLQYMNQGPSMTLAADKKSFSVKGTNSTSFANHAIVPELFLGLNFKDDHFYVQLGGDVQTIRPRTEGYILTEDGTYGKIKVDELLTCFTPTVYFQYVANRFSVKLRSIYAANTSHVNQLMSGYGVTGINEDGSWDYTPLRNTVNYLDFAYKLGKNKNYRINLFLGYMQNLGLAKDAELVAAGTNNLPLFCKGNYTNIHSIYRVAPSVSYNLKHFNFGLEYELTGVRYGKLETTGLVTPERNIINHRICALVKYNF